MDPLVSYSFNERFHVTSNLLIFARSKAINRALKVFITAIIHRKVKRRISSLF